MFYKSSQEIGALEDKKCCNILKYKHVLVKENKIDTIVHLFININLFKEQNNNK